MSESTNNERLKSRDERTMARLLRLAGPGKPIPQDVEARVYNQVQQAWKEASAQPPTERVYENVHREWRRNDRRNALRRWVMPFALAASILLAVAVILQPAPPDATVPPAGSIARVIDGTSGPSLPDVGAPVYPGDTLVTGPEQRIAVMLANGESIRIDQNAEVRIASADRFDLLRGRLYADTGDRMYRARQLTVETPQGIVTDIGTQFVVASGDGRLEVAVREGRVDVTKGTASHTAVAGDLMRFGQDGGAEVEQVVAHDDYWDWTVSVAPEFDIEDRSLLDFLRWAARETGRELVFADRELRMSAMRTDLHGSVSGFDPLEAVASVLATTAYQYRIEADRIIIER